MPDNPHDLQLTILLGVSPTHGAQYLQTAYLESLVLQDPLDGGILTARRELGLEDNTKRAIADNLALSVLDLSSFPSQSILDLFANDFCVELVSARA